MTPPPPPPRQEPCRGLREDRTAEGRAQAAPSGASLPGSRAATGTRPVHRGRRAGGAPARARKARARAAGGAAPSPSPPGPRRPRNRHLLLPRPKGGPTRPRRPRALPRPAGPAAPRRDPAPPHPGPVAAAASAPSLFPSQLPGRHLTFNPLQPITALPQPRESAAPKPRESSAPRPAPRLKGAWPRRGAGRVRPLGGALRGGARGRSHTAERGGDTDGQGQPSRRRITGEATSTAWP